MALDVSHYGTSPSITNTTRDAVPSQGMGFDAAGAKHARSEQEAMPTLATSGPDLKKRRLSKHKSGRLVPRAFSTSHLRGSVMSEAELDKKRNKLGYQRISIACGKSTVPCRLHICGTAMPIIVRVY